MKVTLDLQIESASIVLSNNDKGWWEARVSFREPERKSRTTHPYELSRGIQFDTLDQAVAWLKEQMGTEGEGKAERP